MKKKKSKVFSFIKCILIIVEITLLVYIAYAVTLLVSYVADLECSDCGTLIEKIEKQEQDLVDCRAMVKSHELEIMELSDDLRGI